VVHAYHPATQEVEIGRIAVQGQPGQKKACKIPSQQKKKKKKLGLETCVTPAKKEE
jgi:hypothetical protein